MPELAAVGAIADVAPEIADLAIPAIDASTALDVGALGLDTSLDLGADVTGLEGLGAASTATPEITADAAALGATEGAATLGDTAENLTSIGDVVGSGSTQLGTGFSPAAAAVETPASTATSLGSFTSPSAALGPSQNIAAETGTSLASGSGLGAPDLLPSGTAQIGAPSNIPSSFAQAIPASGVSPVAADSFDPFSAFPDTADLNTNFDTPQTFDTSGQFLTGEPAPGIETPATSAIPIDTGSITGAAPGASPGMPIDQFAAQEDFSSIQPTFNSPVGAEPGSAIYGGTNPAASGGGTGLLGGGNILGSGMNIGQLAGLGSLGYLALKGPGSLPSSAALSANQATFLGGSGEQMIQNAQAGIITPSQQAQLDQQKAQALAQLRAQFYAMGRNPDTDSSFQQAAQNIDAQIEAQRQQFLDAAMQQGLQELGLSETALAQTAQLQVMQNTAFTQSLAAALGGFGRLFSGSSSGATTAVS